MNPSLERSFYKHQDTLSVAEQLIGKRLCTYLDGVLTSGIINETEAYCGIHDRACHTYNDRRTERTETMYMDGGIAYVYICYGIHNMLNAVTRLSDVPEAVLIRSVIAEEGKDLMMQRRKKDTLKDLSNGPGKLCQAFGIDRSMNGISFDSDLLWIEQSELIIPRESIEVTPRIGVDYAGNDALLPYRFHYPTMIA